MDKLEGISWTSGQQGGIGYPPELVRYRNKWYWVEDSRNHGGTICYACSEYRNIPHGFKPGGFAQQPKPYGSACYRSLRPSCKMRSRKMNAIQTMPWEEFRNIIKQLYGEPEVINQG